MGKLDKETKELLDRVLGDAMKAMGRVVQPVQMGPLGIPKMPDTLISLGRKVNGAMEFLCWERPGDCKLIVFSNTIIADCYLRALSQEKQDARWDLVELTFDETRDIALGIDSITHLVLLDDPDNQVLIQVRFMD